MVDDLDTTIEDKLQISRMMGLESLIHSAVQNYKFARSVQSPQDKFKSMITDIMSSSKDPEKTITELCEIKQQMIISLVHTMHPTIFQSRAAKRVIF